MGSVNGISVCSKKLLYIRLKTSTFLFSSVINGWGINDIISNKSSSFTMSNALLLRYVSSALLVFDYWKTDQISIR